MNEPLPILDFIGGEIEQLQIWSLWQNLMINVKSLFLLPFVCDKVVFLHASVILSTVDGGRRACHTCPLPHIPCHTPPTTSPWARIPLSATHAPCGYYEMRLMSEWYASYCSLNCRKEIGRFVTRLVELYLELSKRSEYFDLNSFYTIAWCHGNRTRLFQFSLPPWCTCTYVLL